jgi:hypothetical protein
VADDKRRSKLRSKSGVRDVPVMASRIRYQARIWRREDHRVAHQTYDFPNPSLKDGAGFFVFPKPLRRKAFMKNTTEIKTIPARVMPVIPRVDVPAANVVILETLYRDMGLEPGPAIAAAWRDYAMFHRPPGHGQCEVKS